MTVPAQTLAFAANRNDPMGLVALALGFAMANAVLWMTLHGAAKPHGEQAFTIAQGSGPAVEAASSN
jgi:hypothetical protein